MLTESQDGSAHTTKVKVVVIDLSPSLQFGIVASINFMQMH